MKTIIVDNSEICNPLNGDRIQPPIEPGQHFMPGDELWIGGSKNYRVRVLLANVGLVNPPEGNWFSRIHDRITAMLSGRSPTARSPQPEARYRWSLLCEPIEDLLPLAPRESWLVGRHGEWCSVTVPNDERIYCVKTETLFGSCHSREGGNPVLIEEEKEITLRP